MEFHDQRLEKPHIFSGQRDAGPEYYSKERILTGLQDRKGCLAEEYAENEEFFCSFSCFKYSVNTIFNFSLS
jgi:hypothetical protein